MIAKYNLAQWALFPVHLFLAGLAAFAIKLFCDGITAEFFEGFEVVIPVAWYERMDLVSLCLFLATFLVSSVCAYRMWSHEQTALPGILSAVPSFGSSPTRRSSSGEFTVIEYSVFFRILGNICLSMPLQLLFALQRIRNQIPAGAANERRLQEMLQLAEGQSRWHSIHLYQDDYEALDFLIRMGKLDYSQTKEVVKVRK